MASVTAGAAPPPPQPPPGMFAGADVMLVGLSNAAINGLQGVLDSGHPNAKELWQVHLPTLGKSVAVKAENLAMAEESILGRPTFNFIPKDTLPLNLPRDYAPSPCDVCSAVADPALKCGGCRSRVYCSKKCQKGDWKSGGHKVLCDSLSADKMNRVFVVVGLHGEGEMAAFYSLRKAEADAIAC